MAANVLCGQRRITNNHNSFSREIYWCYQGGSRSVLAFKELLKCDDGHFGIVNVVMRGIEVGMLKKGNESALVLYAKFPPSDAMPVLII